LDWHDESSHSTVYEHVTRPAINISLTAPKRNR
jgi:hypothetical protein